MKFTKYSLIAIGAITILAGCGGGGSSEGSGSEAPAVTEENRAEIFDMFGNGVGVGDTSGVAIFNQNSLPNTPSTTFRIDSLNANACIGTGVFSPSTFVAEANTTQEVSFSIPFGDFEKCITDKITFNYAIVNEGIDLKFTKEITNPTYDQDKVYKEANTDPLFQYQWHLLNTGQRTGVSTPAVAGNDINVASVWDSGITGKGITVAVIDTGVDMFQPDLIDNLRMDLSHNYHTGKYISEGGINNTTPVRYTVTMTNPDSGSELTGGYYDYRHGTAVAGIIAAKGWNGIGGRGVAPNAGLVSYNSLETYGSGDETESALLFLANKIPYVYSTAELQLRRLVNALTGHIDVVDVYNNSWGSQTSTLNYGFDLRFEDTLKYGVVQGRDGKGSIYVKAAGNSSSWNNFEPMQTNPYMIVVAASGAGGEASSYTNLGPNTWINAPGGGAQDTNVKPNLHEIVTTDMAGLDRGYDSNIAYLSDTQHFNVKGNENYDYTQLMNGTSAAAPIVSGVAALMLEANPNLTWRDVKYILARTSTRNDSTDSSWHTNGAGYWYSYLYGFGRVDATKAVQLARNFASLGGLYDMKSATGSGSYVRSTNGTVKNTINLQDNITIEHVKVNLSLDLNPLPRYKTYNFAGTSSTLTDDFTLYKGDSQITVHSTFAADGNGTQTTVTLVPVAEIVGEDDSTDIGTITFEEPDSIIKKVTLEANGQYRLNIDSNASSWSVAVKTQLPHTQASQIKVLLTSPNGTESLLASAPNDLNDTAENYSGVTLSSVEFLDEKSQGDWTLDIQDMNWTEDFDATYDLNSWSIDIVGR